jgi:hypothetical protein
MAIGMVGDFRTNPTKKSIYIELFFINYPQVSVAQTLESGFQMKRK